MGALSLANGRHLCAKKMALLSPGNTTPAHPPAQTSVQCLQTEPSALPTLAASKFRLEGKDYISTGIPESNKQSTQRRVF